MSDDTPPPPSSRARGHDDEPVRVTPEGVQRRRKEGAANVADLTRQLEGVHALSEGSARLRLK